MWRVVLLIIVLFPALVLGEEHIGNNYSTSMFSIEIPEGMEIDEYDTNQISLIFANDPELELGTISISAKKPKNLINKEKAWDKIRSLALNGRKLLSEGDVQIAGMTWKIISMVDDIDDCRIKSNTFYTFTKTASYSIYYNCEPSNCGKITEAFNQITSSLKIK